MKKFIGLFIVLVLFTLLMGQSQNKQPLKLEISLSGSGTDLTVILTNESRKPVMILEKNALGQFENLRFIIVSDENDSVFVDFDGSFEEYGRKHDKQPKLEKMKRRKKSQCAIEQFIDRYADVFQSGHEYTIQAVYQTVYETPRKDHESARSEMFEKDVYSNNISYKKSE